MKSEPIQKILEMWRVAKQGATSKAAKKARYGDQAPTAEQVRAWREQQEAVTKDLQYGAAAHLISLISGHPTISRHLKNIRRAFKRDRQTPQYTWADKGGSGTLIKIGNANSNNVPDLVIHKGGSQKPTATVEVASGVNKMWGSLIHTPQTPISFPSGSVFHRMQHMRALTPEHMDEIQKAIDNKVKSPRVAKSTNVDSGGRHTFMREIEAGLRSQGVSHIMVGGRVFSTEHRDGVVNLSHVVRKMHITTSAGKGGKRLGLRISGLRDPSTGQAIEGSEDNYNRVINKRGFGDAPSTLIQ